MSSIEYFVGAAVSHFNKINIRVKFTAAIRDLFVCDSCFDSFHFNWCWWREICTFARLNGGMALNTMCVCVLLDPAIARRSGDNFWRVWSHKHTPHRRKHTGCLIAGTRNDNATPTTVVCDDLAGSEFRELNQTSNWLKWMYIFSSWLFCIIHNVSNERLIRNQETLSVTFDKPPKVCAIEFYAHFHHINREPQSKVKLQ